MKFEIIIKTIVDTEDYANVEGGSQGEMALNIGKGLVKGDTDWPERVDVEVSDRRVV